jgi:hypothetical protein
MDKLRYSSWKLEFRHYPLNILFSTVVLLIAQTWIILSVTNKTLICTKSSTGQGDCQIFRTTVLQPHPNKIREFPVDALQKAEITTKDFRYCYNLRLKGSQEPIAFRCVKEVNRQSLQSEVIHINSFIASDSKLALRIEEGGEISHIFYLNLAGMGFLLWMLIAHGRVSIAVFDKASGLFGL